LKYTWILRYIHRKINLKFPGVVVHFWLFWLITELLLPLVSMVGERCWV